MNLYTAEKEMEFERERMARRPQGEASTPRPRKTIFGPLAAMSGRALRRVGEGLESWGSPPPPEHEHKHSHAHNGM